MRWGSQPRVGTPAPESRGLPGFQGQRFLSGGERVLRRTPSEGFPKPLAQFDILLL